MARNIKENFFFYSSRTEGYYYRRGGIYKEIIYLLERMMRSNLTDKTWLYILNEACFLANDYIVNRPNLSQWIDEYFSSNSAITKYDRGIIMGCVYILLYEDLSTDLRIKLRCIVEIPTDFISLALRNYLESHKAPTPTPEELSKQLDTLRREVNVLKEENERLRKLCREVNVLKEENERLRKLRRGVNVLKEENERLRKQIVMQGSKEKTVDDVLTFGYIYDYIKTRTVYGESQQLFKFISHTTNMCGAREQYERFDELQNEMRKNSVPSIHNHNEISNSNVFQGDVHSPKFKESNSENE